MITQLSKTLFQYLSAITLIVALNSYQVWAQIVMDNAGDIGIGVLIVPDPSAKIEVKSTTKGFLMPRMTDAQRDAIVNPATGLQIYNTDVDAFQVNTGTISNPVWETVLTDNTVGEVAWLLGGNATSTSNVFGTLDGTDIDVRTNNTTAITVDGVDQDVSIERNLIVYGEGEIFDDLSVYSNSYVAEDLTVDGNTTLGSNPFNNWLDVNAVITANGQGNRVGDYSANQQLTIGGVVDAAIGNTLAGNPTVWDMVVDGDAIVQGLIKVGSSIWIGATPNNHRIIANDAFNIGTSTADNLTLFTEGIVGLTVSGSNQHIGIGVLPHSSYQLNVDNPIEQNSLRVVGRTNLAGNYSPLRAQNSVGSGETDGNVDDILVSRGADFTPSWKSPNELLDGLFWGLTGNMGTTAGPNFLGTMDDEPFEIHVYDDYGMTNEGTGRVARIEPNTGSSSSPNIILGFQGNNVSSGVKGATISGGGNSIGKNSVTADFGTISGGNVNTASGPHATISGGERNEASGGLTTISGGAYNNASSTYATIGGGIHNTADGFCSTIGGGDGNVISGHWATISGGIHNSTSGFSSAIPGGTGLTLKGHGSFGFLGDNNTIISGPPTNPMTINASNVAVFGNTSLWLANNNNAASQLRFYEANNTIGIFPPTGTGSEFYTSFEAGDQIADISYILPLSTSFETTTKDGVLQLEASTGQLSWVDPNALCGSCCWKLNGNAGTTAGTNFLGTTDDEVFEVHVYHDYSTANQGTGRVARFEPRTGSYTSPNIILGYKENGVSTGAYGATIGGGGSIHYANEVAARFGTISGGLSNTTSGHGATVGGGDGNSASGSTSIVGGGKGNSASGQHATISGGQLNSASGYGSSLSGGRFNTVSGNTATVGGGLQKSCDRYLSNGWRRRR